LKCKECVEGSSPEFCPSNAKEFVSWLLSLMKKYKTAKVRAFEEFFGVPHKELISLTERIPLWSWSQHVYLINKFLREKTKIIDVCQFSEFSCSAPVFKEIQYKRGKRELCLVLGFVAFEWKKTRFFFSIWAETSSPGYEIYTKSENRKIIKELFKEIREYFKENIALRGEKLELTSRGAFRFLNWEKTNSDDLILSEEIWDEIHSNIIYPLEHPEKFKQGIYKRGILLGGPPGTGKTLLCKILATRLNTTIIWATAKSLEYPRLVASLFSAARELSPTLVIIEDLDFIGESRNLVKNPALGELLAQMDGLPPNSGVFVLATTNRPEILDLALANRPGRFDVKLYFGPPEIEEIKKLLKKFKKEYKCRRIDINSLAIRLSGLTGAHIRELFQYAYFKSRRKGRTFIREKDLLEALSHMKKGLDKEKSGII